MANKENLLPRSFGQSRGQQDETSTPPGLIPSALGLRSWQHAAFDSPPLSRFSPNNNPSLSQQRDHSECGRTGSPLTLKVRKTRENLRECDPCAHIPPPCLQLLPDVACETPTKPPSVLNQTSREKIWLHGVEREDATIIPQHLPLRRKSASRRMLSKVKEGFSNRSRSYQSVRNPETDASLIRRLSGKCKDNTNAESRAHSFEISRNSVDLNVLPSESKVPYVELQIIPDPPYIDSAYTGEILVKIEAAVQSRPCTLSPAVEDYNSQEFHTSQPLNREVLNRQYTIGSITSLRLCYKPMNDCKVTHIAGQRTVKNLRIGQRCCLSLKLRVPKVQTTQWSPSCPPDQGSLFTELESMLGVLQIEILQVEIKYRHSLLSADNVVTVRQTCSIKRPQIDSQWSVIHPSRAGTELTTLADQPALVVTDTERGAATHTDVQDSARQVWRHIRHLSLSTNHLDELKTRSSQQIETNDTIRALKAKALANKRSVGAETLIGWQWEEKKMDGEAPWL